MSEQCPTLSEIKALLKPIYDALGIPKDWEGGGVQVPNLLTKKKSDTIKVTSLPQILIWQTKQLDALLGQFPIEIEIEDNDLIQTGDQKLEFSLPNVAESLAEVTGLLLATKALLEANLHASFDTLAEVGNTKNTGILSYYLLEAVTDYLGFKTKKKKIDVQYAFNPLAGYAQDEPDTIANALKATVQKLIIEEYDQKDNLQEDLHTLIESARIIKARFWRRFDKDGLMQLYKSVKDVLDDNVGKTDEEGKIKTDFDLFLETVEQGFISYANINDPQKPYGKDFTRRPKIVELGKQNDT